jgi:hypothetical protein
VHAERSWPPALRRTLYWKASKEGVDDKTPQMKVARIRAVEVGRVTPQLQR